MKSTSVHIDKEIVASIAVFGGVTGAHGVIFIRNASNQQTITISGETGDISLSGDITLSNADIAEEFFLAEPNSALDAGTVVVLNCAGQILSCSKAYDRSVAGIIAGTGLYRPGIVLDRRSETNSRAPVSFVGKVLCKADARYGEIHSGDLLTTSPTDGHAMVVADPVRAFGATIGKALGSLTKGIGLIPALVALQ